MGALKRAQPVDCVLWIGAESDCRHDIDSTQHMAWAVTDRRTACRSFRLTLPNALLERRRVMGMTPRSVMNGVEESHGGIVVRAL